MAPLSVRPASRRFVFVGWAILSLMIVVGLGWQYVDIESQCRESALNRTAIRESILDGFSSVGYRYEPTSPEATADGVVAVGGELDYYTKHPGERDRQVKQLIRSIKRFPPVRC